MAENPNPRGCFLASFALGESRFFFYSYLDLFNISDPLSDSQVAFRLTQLHRGLNSRQLRLRTAWHMQVVLKPSVLVFRNCTPNNFLTYWFLSTKFAKALRENLPNKKLARKMSKSNTIYIISRKVIILNILRYIYIIWTSFEIKL